MPRTEQAAGLSPTPAERDHVPVHLLERDDFLDTLVGYADDARRGESRDR